MKNCIIWRLLTILNSRLLRRLRRKSVFVRINSVKNGIYHLQDTLCKADGLSVPYLFVLEDNMAVSNFFIPRKEYPQITERYLQSIRGLVE